MEGLLASIVDSGNPEPGTSGGVLAWSLVAGGVDAEAGVFDLDGLPLSEFPEVSGSLEC